jgi:hypothetical protein
LLHLLPHAMLSGAGNTFFFFSYHMERCMFLVMLIPDPGFFPSRFSDPTFNKNAKKKRGKKCVVLSFICSHKFHQILHYLMFEQVQKKIGVSWHKIKVFFTKKNKKNCYYALKYGLGSGIRDPEKTRSRIRIKGSKNTRSRSATLFESVVAVGRFSFC